MKRVLIACVLVIAIVCLYWVFAYQRAYRAAREQLHARHQIQPYFDDYEFVTRGIRAGMPFDGVVALLGKSALRGDLKDNYPADPEPYRANFAFEYKASFNLLLRQFEKNFIAEDYTVYFDVEKRATRIEYRVIIPGSSVVQTVHVDLTRRKLSESLSFDWRL